MTDPDSRNDPVEAMKCYEELADEDVTGSNWGFDFSGEIDNFSGRI